MKFARKYPALAVIVLAAAYAGASSPAAVAGTVIMPDGGIRYDYGRRPAPFLACKPEYVCDIALDSGETILNVAIGDGSRWIIASGKSGANNPTPHVFVKAKEADLDTNLVITTTKRVYDITLHSAGNANHPHISFFYADDDAAAKAAQAEHERQAIAAVLAGTPQVGADQVDARYKLSGPAALLPEKVYNDGARTFIQWKSALPELPFVFAIAKDGTPTQVNVRVVGTKLVVDDVGQNYDLVLPAVNRGRAEQRVSIRHE
jgi:type IV secretion system protein VirB9